MEGSRKKGRERGEGNRDDSPKEPQIEHRVKRVGPSQHSHPSTALDALCDTLSSGETAFRSPGSSCDLPDERAPNHPPLVWCELPPPYERPKRLGSSQQEA